MKRIREIGVYKSGNRRLEIVDLTNVKSTVNEDTALFVGHTTVTKRVGGQDFSASYRISRSYRKQQGLWRMVASRRTRVVQPDVRVGNHLRRAAA